MAGRSGPSAGEVAGLVATPEPTMTFGIDPEFPVAVAASTPSPTPGIVAPTVDSGARPAATPAAAPTTIPAATPTAKAPSASPAVATGMDLVPDAPHGPDPATLTGYRWPIAHPRLTLPFGPTPWGGWIVGGKNFHDGIDLATFCNDRIGAAHDGIVIAAGRHFDNEIGWVGSLAPYYARLDKKHLWNTLPIVIIVDDGNGYRSIYAHFWKVVVKKGDTVKAGQLLGYEGMTGRASGCHLHYGLFSPVESATFGTDKDVAKRMKLPHAEIARIDPLLVLPPRAKGPKPSAAP